VSKLKLKPIWLRCNLRWKFKSKNFFQRNFKSFDSFNPFI